MKRQIAPYLKLRLKMESEPAYRLAQRAGMDPNYLSKLINGIVEIEETDPRISRLCSVLSIPIGKIFKI